VSRVSPRLTLFVAGLLNVDPGHAHLEWMIFGLVWRRFGDHYECRHDPKLSGKKGDHKNKAAT
jgi:hypothetical protein